MAKIDFINQKAVEAAHQMATIATQALTEMMVSKGYTAEEIHFSPIYFLANGNGDRSDYGFCGLTWKRAVATVRDLPNARRRQN